MKKIKIIIDYKGFFGSKQKSLIYRGGMDLGHLVRLFNYKGFDVEILNFSDIDFVKIKQESPFVIYTSSEDFGGFYKSFIEDIILSLEDAGLTCLPSYNYLRAHNNKVYMELLRRSRNFEELSSISSRVFGSFEELKNTTQEFKFPVVIKPASGAMSRGVSIAYNYDELLKKTQKISSTRNIIFDLKDRLRKLKYGDRYVPESLNRSKFIVQNFIPNLNNDWKVLVYGNKLFILYRGNRENDFRASGSGKFIFRKDIPEGILDYAYSIMKKFDVPNISLDIGFDGKQFHTLEFQFLYFGTTTLEKSPFYFEKNGNSWDIVDKSLCLEEVYVESIVHYLREK